MDNFSDTYTLLDLHEGQFVENVPIHSLYFEKSGSKLVAGMLRVMQIAELEQFHLNRQMRNELIDRLSDFYALHVQPFGSLKSLPVLRTLWAD